jgi:predicted ATPase
MKNKRVVISGSPGAGKTTLIERLQIRGYSTFEEYSRTLLKTAIEKGDERYFLTNPQEFSEALFLGRKKQYEAFDSLTTESPFVFFDRGIHDVYAYLRAIGAHTEMWHTRVSGFQYDFVFLLTPWEAIYKVDNQRKETFEEAQHYFSFIEETYAQSHQVILVPQGTVEERITFIESKLNLHG